MILEFKRFNCVEIVECCEINVVTSCCKMLDIFAIKENGVNPADEVSNFIVVMLLLSTVFSRNISKIP